jgi:hypothetical protein
MINIFITAYILSCFKEVASFFLSRTQVIIAIRVVGLSVNFLLHRRPERDNRHIFDDCSVYTGSVYSKNPLKPGGSFEF